jgi:hypothetical protein
MQGYSSSVLTSFHSPVSTRLFNPYAKTSRLGTKRTEIHNPNIRITVPPVRTSDNDHHVAYQVGCMVSPRFRNRARAFAGLDLFPAQLVERNRDIHRPHVVERYRAVSTWQHRQTGFEKQERKRGMDRLASKDEKTPIVEACGVCSSGNRLISLYVRFTPFVCESVEYVSVEPFRM